MDIKQLETRIYFLMGSLEEAKLIFQKAAKELKEQEKKEDKKD